MIKRPVPHLRTARLRRGLLLLPCLIWLALPQACSRCSASLTPEQTVTAAAYDFKTLASTDYVTALATYAEPAAIARFHSFDEVIWPATNPRVGWAFLMNTSVMVLGARVNNLMTVTFYHPWSDVALVTAWWSPEGSLPRLVDAEVLMGDFFRRSGQPRFETSRPWMRQDQYRPVAVGLSTAETVRAIEYFLKHAKQGPKGWRSVLPGLSDSKVLTGNYYGAGTMLMANLSELSGVYDPQDDAGRALQKKISQLFKAVTYGDLRELAQAPQNTEEARAALAGLPAAEIRPFQLAAFIGGKEKSLLMLCRPDNPDVYLSLLFERERNGYKLARADLMSFQKYYELPTGQGGK